MSRISNEDIRRMFKEQYTFDREMSEIERIVDILNWLSTSFPRHSIPMNLLHLFVRGGNRALNESTTEVKAFSTKVCSTARSHMLKTHDKHIYVKNKLVRALCDAEDHIVNVLPQKNRAINSQITRLKSLTDKAIGDPNKVVLKNPANQKFLDQAKRSIPALNRMDSFVKALLPEKAT